MRPCSVALASDSLVRPSVCVSLPSPALTPAAFGELVGVYRYGSAQAASVAVSPDFLPAQIPAEHAAGSADAAPLCHALAAFHGVSSTPSLMRTANASAAATAPRRLASRSVRCSWT